MKFRKHRKRKRGEGNSYWQSYSDMMAALLLMFVLIMSLTLLQSLKTYEDKLKEKEEQIRIQQEQKEQLEEQQELLDKQQEQIDNLIGVKAKLIEALSDEFEHSAMSINVDQNTGAIMFDASILFDFNKSELKKSGKKFLNRFLPIYYRVLTSNEFREYVSEIIIEGHTDTEGEYIYNLKLSQARALSVATYCLGDDNKSLNGSQKKQLREILTANGKSWSDPIYKKRNVVDQDASRRVEFKFRLKDEEMIEELKSILEEQHEIFLLSEEIGKGKRRD